MRHADFLERGRHAQVTSPCEPLGAVLQAPLQEATALIELANQREEFIGCRVDASAEVEDVLVEFFDGIYRSHDESLSLE